MVRSADLTLIIILATTTMAISKITEPSGTVLLLFILFSISRAKKLARFPPPAVECPIYQWGIHHLAGQRRTRRTDRSQGCLCKQWVDSFLAKKRGLFQLLNRKKKGQKYENWAILKVSSVGWKKMSKGAQKEARIRSSAPSFLPIAQDSVFQPKICPPRRESSTTRRHSMEPKSRRKSSKKKNSNCARITVLTALLCTKILIINWAIIIKLFVEDRGEGWETHEGDIWRLEIGDTLYRSGIEGRGKTYS